MKVGFVHVYYLKVVAAVIAYSFWINRFVKVGNQGNLVVLVRPGVVQVRHNARTVSGECAPLCRLLLRLPVDVHLLPACTGVGTAVEHRCRSCVFFVGLFVICVVRVPGVRCAHPDVFVRRVYRNGINAEVYDGYIVSDGFDISADSLYNDGYYTIQDSAAMQTAKVLAPCEGDTVIDMCAAPGGKTTHIAELMNNKGKIYAFDVHEHKIELIKKNAERLGITIIEPKLSDGCKIDESMINTADKILCDVPCSGLGIIGRKPEIKWNRAEDNDLPKIQRQILDNASKYLKINGEIVYSTCTIEKEENEAVTDSFTADNENFEKVFEKTFYPHIDNTDGFYICKMKRIK